MIEIVKHGNSTLLCKCPKCGCKLSFLPHDICFDYMEDKIITHSGHITCPKCGEKCYKTIKKYLLANMWG